MIDFTGFDITRLDAEYLEALDEFENMLLWVTDRLGTVTKAKYELDCGNIILLGAAWGKMHTLEGMATRSGITWPDDEGLSARRIALDRTLCQHLEVFREEVETELENQFRNSVVSDLARISRDPHDLDELHDLEHFFSKRDTVELFAIASDHFFPGFHFRDQVSNIERKIKDYILHVAVYNLKKEYASDVLKELTIRYLPPEFWWRHIEWA